MPYPTLYPPQTNSPTTTSTAITSSQTTINVVDGSVLPDAPCPLTIGGDEDAETVLMTANAGNTLTVERGFDNTVAKAWVSGETIARNFNADDHKSLQEWVRGNKEAAEAAQDAADRKITGGYEVSIAASAWTASGNTWVATVTDAKIPAETAEYRISPHINWNEATLANIAALTAWVSVKSPAAGGSYTVTVGYTADEAPEKPDFTMIGDMEILEVKRI